MWALKLIALIEAGINLAELKAEIQARQATGATNRDISKFIHEKYEASFKELNETN